MHVHPLEKQYFIFTVVLMGVFAAALAVGSLAFGVQLPGPYQQVDPTTIRAEGGTSGLPFDLPEEERFREIAPGQYEAYIHSYAWGFSPRGVAGHFLPDQPRCDSRVSDSRDQHQHDGDSGSSFSPDA